MRKHIAWPAPARAAHPLCKGLRGGTGLQSKKKQFWGCSQSCELPPFRINVGIECVFAPSVPWLQGRAGLLKLLLRAPFHLLWQRWFKQTCFTLQLGPARNMPVVSSCCSAATGELLASLLLITQMSEWSQKVVVPRGSWAQHLERNINFLKKLNKPCIFPPKMLCTRDKVSGCSWGGKIADAEHFFLLRWEIRCRLIVYISAPIPNTSLPCYFCSYHPAAHRSEGGWAIPMFCHYTNMPCFYRHTRKIKREQQKLQTHT